MKCPQCRTEMTERRETIPYDGCELRDVTLVGVPVRTCPACGERAVAIPRIAELFRVLALTVIQKPGRLAPDEVRFLRKFLGWSGDDFAACFGVSRGQVSRWETGAKPMSALADRLLRVCVARVEPADSYPIEALKNVEKGAPPPAEPHRVQAKPDGWESLPIAA